MSLFPPNPTPLSAEKLQRANFNIRNQAKDTFNNLVLISNSYVRSVWYNPNFTAQQLITSLSADAVKQLNYSLSLRTHLLSVIISEGIPLSSVNLLRPVSAYSITGSTVTLIPSAYSGL